MSWLILAALAAGPLSSDDCVAIALERSARVHAAQAEVEVVRAQAAQIESALSPKLSVLTYLAPMYGASGGIGLEGPYSHDFTRWGPYAHGEVRLIKPLSTFGRYTKGVEAADERARVEEERAREIAGGVRFEVRKLYGLRLYALSLRPNLETGAKILGEAIVKGEELYRAGTGEVTLPDLMRLRYGRGEVERYLRLATDGADLALAALKQAMGLRIDEALELNDKLVPDDRPVPTLEELVARARRDRPEMAQIEHGKAATAAWEESERRANFPVLFAAAAGQGDFSTVRPKGFSAALYNSYNDYFVGVAVGLKLDLDAPLARAKASEARAKAAWVAANEVLAATGIPLQVMKARQELVQQQDLARIADEEVRSTRKWMTFAAAAYAGGTGEAKDVLEGVGAYLLSKKAHYDHLLGAWQARADLEQATGAR